VSVHDRNLRRLDTVKVCDLPKTKTPEWVRGKILFNTANYPLSARRWIACASCHPDGHHDGRVWQNPEGLRKTTAMFGVAHTRPSAERGKALFFSKEVGCAKCHSGPYYTDSTLKEPYNLHDVGTGDDDKSEKMGPRYDTPSLLGIYRTPPYLHHGKAKTLHDVLAVYNKQDKHGKTTHLKPAEIDELVAFLKSLPYEQPPEVTPNTVEYRVPPSLKKKG